MLISRKHNFIYVHIPKAAGQSITNALVPYAALNYQKALAYVVPFRYQLKLLSALKRYLNLYVWPQPYADHARAWQICESLGEEYFSEYFSFTFVRNPWDRLLSAYSYALVNKRHGRHKLISSFSGFNDYVRWHCIEDSIGLQSDFVFGNDGRKLLSYVGRVENIEAGIGEIEEAIGIQLRLSKHNVSNTLNYRNVYSKDTRELVARTYAPDIDAFDYSF